MKIDTFRGQFGFLSNMSECKVVRDGIEFNSVEQGFQYFKTASPNERVKILQCKTPRDTKLLSKKFKHIRDNWNEIRDQIMYELLKSKFTLNTDYREALLATKGFELVEGNWWGDVYWGKCDGVGKNKLGKLLMKVRDEI